MEPASYEHQAVLLQEALEALNVRADGVYIDGTFGRGGHARAILARIGGGGRLLAIDKDPEAVAAARMEFASDPRFSIAQGSFAMLEQIARSESVTGDIDGILLDLGVSSPQLEDPARGFSFMSDGPLDMRMDPSRGQSAADWLASVDEGELDRVLRVLGEERYHRRIARAVVTARARAPVATTKQLAALVDAAVPSREKHKHPATRTFQAIRIHINHELEDLDTALQQSLAVLAAGGRLAVISFHSLEDRIVKRFMREQSSGADKLPPDLPVRDAQIPRKLRLVGKPVRPGAAEVAANPRARSAIMRVAERLA
jgi:16S rRNA (cytosine1402-N4)-methyltransferase